MAESRQEFGTVLGPDAKFKGDMIFDSAAKLLGTVEGSIQSEGQVVVAQGAVCKANVTAKEVCVEGDVEGDMQAHERIELKPNAKVSGDIVAPRLAVSEGATIQGHVRIGVEANAEIPRNAPDPKAAKNGGSKSAHPALSR